MLEAITNAAGADLSAARIERLLDLLPVGFARFALEARLPKEAPAEVVIADLLEKTRLEYFNPGFAVLEGARAESLAGARLGSLAIGRAFKRVGGPARFARDGFRLDREEVRIAAGEIRRFLEVTAVAIVDGELITALWCSVTDVSAAHDLATRVAAAESEHGDEPIVGTSASIQRVLEKISQVAGTDTTVLITGETGTGKELIARAIHQRSPRAARPLVAINCGAISASLVESELFGHEKGAFTGAAARKIGRFELADGGTLFLDEIGDLPLELQIRLLRVLQESEFVRVGGTESVRVDVRVIAATHRDLPAAVRAGTFRQDLYYRLNVFPIKSPPLRERREDVPLLVEHFTRRFAARLGKRIESIPASVIEALQRHPWPGNIRELVNLIERSVIITNGPVLQLGEWATGQFQPVAMPAVPGDQTLEAMERDHIVRALERAGWKVSGPGGAAEALNLKPTTLEARMKKLGIVRPR